MYGPYEATIFASNREMDQVVEANTNNRKVKEDFMTCLDGEMIKSNEEDESTMP